MFGNKKQASGIDPEQKEMIENARRRIKQKRALFTHFVIFLIGSVGLIVIANRPNVTEIPRFLDIQWWVWVIFFWLLLLAYHAFNVLITKRLLGPEWEKKQYNRLVQKQQKRILEIEKKVVRDHPNPTPQISLETPEKKRVVTMIAAAGANNELGKDGDLVWHLPDDFKRFKRLTTNHHIIMGRKTFESFPKPLPNRTHIILTRDASYKSEQGIVVHDLDTALAAASGDENPFIIGGGEIYKQAMSVADVIELTRVHGSFESDTFFPKIDESQWKLVNSLHHPADDKHQYSFDFETWVRK